MPDTLYLSQVTLPDGNTYNLKDSEARTAIAALEAYTDYLGVTTTTLTDGASTNPITIDGESVTAKKGNIANYGAKEFIFNGSVWQEFGDLSALGELAYEDTAEGTYTPAGTISAPTTTVATTSATVYSITDVGSLPVVAPQSVTVNSITDVGTLPTVAPTTATVNSITDVGTLPTFTVSGEVLTFGAGTLPTKGADQTVVSDVGYTAGTLPTKGANQTVVSDVGYTAGTLPTKGAAQTVVGSVDSATTTAPTFTGTEATITVGAPA